MDNETRLTRDLYDSLMREVSMRDLIAIHSLQGLLASSMDVPAKRFAELSYLLADEMLRAREV